MRILLTGITGVLGEPLARRLAKSSEIDEVVGVSRGPLPAGLAAEPKISHIARDFRSPEVAEALARTDVLIHSAFQPYGHDLGALHAVNVEGSARLHRAAITAGVRYVVFISSAAAYGSHPDNRVPLPEGAPLRPNPESFYSVHKAAVEHDLDLLEAQTEDLTVLRVRPSILLGPRADLGAEAIRRYYHRFVPRFKGDLWYWQFMDTADAAEAIARAVENRLSGALNIAGDGWLTLKELAETTGGRLLTLPAALTRLVPVLHRLRIAPVGRDRLVLTRDPIVISNRRMHEETGVSPLTSKEALLEFLGARRLPHP